MSDEQTAGQDEIRVDLGPDDSIVLFAGELFLFTGDAQEAWRFALSLREGLENAPIIPVIISSGPPALERIRRAVAQQTEDCLR